MGASVDRVNAVRILARKPRAVLEPSFALGENPLEQISKKSNQLRVRLALCRPSPSRNRTCAVRGAF